MIAVRSKNQLRQRDQTKPANEQSGGKKTSRTDTKVSVRVFVLRVEQITSPYQHIWKVSIFRTNLNRQSEICATLVFLGSGRLCCCFVLYFIAACGFNGGGESESSISSSVVNQFSPVLFVAQLR
jgi:hypothetical protein